MATVIVPHLQAFVRHLQHFPWRDAARLLRQRFREDRLGQAAGSLTFTTTMALVPLITVGLAVFTAFPIFAEFQDVVQRRLVESLVPESIARQVLNSLSLFANKASRLGSLGVVLLIISALALVFTIDRSLNAIWRVRQRRPLAQRLLLYWTTLTLVPLMAGLALVAMAQLVAFTRDWLGPWATTLRDAFEVMEFALVTLAFSALYRYVPYTQVRWSHALVGGLWVSGIMGLARNALAVYIAKMSTFSMIYGAFAAVPILLVWIYLFWGVALTGAVLVANLPRLLSEQVRPFNQVGWRFQLATEALQRLHAHRQTPSHGLGLLTLSESLRVDPLQLEEVLAVLVDLDWVGRLHESGQDHHQSARYVLLADPQETPLQPLMARLLIVPTDANQGLWRRTADWRLRDVL